MPTEVYESGDVMVDLGRMELRRAGQVYPLEPKAFDVLRHLIENRDRLVSKDELLDAVWKDTFVTPNVLTRAVAQLRKALDDDAFAARYIETVSKRGYRFIAPLRVTDDGQAGPATTRPPQVAAEAAPPSPPARLRWVVLAAAGLGAVGLMAASPWLTSRDRPAPAGDIGLPTPRRLTVAPDAYGSPAISPDGSTVAYVSDRSGTQEIVVAGFAPESRQVPITSDGGLNVQPAFSPDGQWLAFHSRKRGGIWVVPSTGGAPRQMADFGMQPSWSPDSRTIVFTSHGGGLTSQAVLWTVRRDGASPIQLTRLGDPLGGHAAPAWSHGGRLIAFKVGRHEEREIWIMDASGGAPRRLATLARDSAPRFSPDDRAVYWVDKTTDGNDCLMRVRLSGEGEAEGEPEVVLPFHGEGVGHLSIARNGTAVFPWSRLAANLFAVDIDAGGEAGPPVQLTFDDAVNAYPDYSLAGRVAFQQRGAGRPDTAWLMDDDGRNIEPLSAGLSASVRAPQWDAEGKSVLLFVEPGSDQKPYFGWMDLATRQLTRVPLPSSSAANQPSLSPDGETLAYHLIAADGALNVWIERLDGGAPRQITFDREAASYPRWSQDGKWLAVNLKRGSETHIGVVSADGGPVEQLTSGPGIRWPYTFSPDGDRIAFAGEVAGSRTWNIYSVARRTKEVKQLTRFTVGGARFPAWSPRGDRIVFTRGDWTNSLWTLKLPS